MWVGCVFVGAHTHKWVRMWRLELNRGCLPQFSWFFWDGVSHWVGTDWLFIVACQRQGCFSFCPSGWQTWQIFMWVLEIWAPTTKLFQYATPHTYVPKHINTCTRVQGNIELFLPAATHTVFTSDISKVLLKTANTGLSRHPGPLVVPSWQTEFENAWK